MAVKIDIDPNGDGGFSFSPCFRKIFGRVPCLNAVHAPHPAALSRLNEEAGDYDAGPGDEQRSGSRPGTQSGVRRMVTVMTTGYKQNTSFVSRFNVLLRQPSAARTTPKAHPWFLDLLVSAAHSVGMIPAPSVTFIFIIRIAGN